jgi:trigger factor
MVQPKSELRSVGACKRELQVELTAEEVSKEFDQVVNQYSRRAKVKGFRQGKAPRDVVKQMYESEIRETLVNNLAPQAIGRELASHTTVPVNTPVVKDIDWDEGGPMRLTAEFEVWPEFTLPGYTKIRVEQKATHVTPEDIENSIEDLRERSAQYVPVEDRSIRQDDYVMAQIQGKDVKTRRLLPAEKIFVLAGHPDNEKELNQALPGMTLNEEKNFRVDYPKEHQNKKLAGREIDYHLKIVSIKEKKLPTVDDGFAKDLGKFSDLKELKEEIKRQLEETQVQKQKSDLSSEIVKTISDQVDVELPESLVQQETVAHLRRILQSLRQAPTKQEDRARLEEEAARQARQTLKNHLVLMRIAEAEKLEVTEEDMTEEYKSLAKANNIPLAQVIDAMNRDNRKAEVRENLLLRKTIDFLVKNAIIK